MLSGKTTLIDLTIKKVIEKRIKESLKTKETKNNEARSHCFSSF